MNALTSRVELLMELLLELLKVVAVLVVESSKQSRHTRSQAMRTGGRGRTL